MTETHETDYVRQLLQMNPVEQSTEIVTLRHNFLHPQDKLGRTVNEEFSSEDRREHAIKKIEAVRKHFWSLKERMLYQQLEEIEVSEFPDLALALSRLTKIVELRASFQRLRQHYTCFEDFHDQFCALVIASPGKTDDLRMAFLDASRQEPSGFDLRGPEDYHRVVTTIQQEFPELYQLEKYWLNQVAASTKQHSSIRRTVRILYFSIAAALGLTLFLCLIYVLDFVSIPFWSQS